MLLFFFILGFRGGGVSGFDVTDITDKVFGNGTNYIPAAFGDFNGDRLTDIVVLKSNPGDDVLAVSIMLANEPNVVSTASSSDPLFRRGTRDQNLQCNFVKGSLTSAVPGDFDGDGGMDLLVTYKNLEELKGVILWGHHTEHLHQLTCIEDQRTEWRKEFKFENEPLVFDYNYDYVSDLLVVTPDGNRTVYVFSDDRSKPYETIDLDTNQTDQLKAQHSNAHIDMNGDGMADLLLTTQSGIELYRRQGDDQQKNFVFHGHIPWPKEATSGSCTVDECVGQLIFADFSLSGTLDIIVPMCYDSLCKSSNLFLISFGELWEAKQWTWKPMSIDIGSLHFYPPSPKDNPLQLMAPRVGDIDLDGFPDLLIALQNSTAQPEVHLLQNVPCGKLSGCHPYWRQFQLQPNFMKGSGNPVMGTFFDLFEDGRPDILTVSGSPASGFKMAAFTNTSQDSDAYFVKVVVLSGACFHNCRNKSSIYVPYGTNSGGQTISYRSQRAGPETFDSFQSVAAQLPQSAHFTLQTPYTIFGLGLSPNFIDYLWVNISSKTHSWPQIIPNSQLYVIPYPPNRPEEWEAKISIFPSKNIVITGLAMIGTCFVTVLLILVLHWRERRQDRQAKLQESNRFHFDAM